MTGDLRGGLGTQLPENPAPPGAACSARLPRTLYQTQTKPQGAEVPRVRESVSRMWSGTCPPLPPPPGPAASWDKTVLTRHSPCSLSRPTRSPAPSPGPSSGRFWSRMNSTPRSRGLGWALGREEGRLGQTAQPQWMLRVRERRHLVGCCTNMCLQGP